MVLRAFPYSGSKGRHAEWIISQMANHNRYVEPFCGSAAVFFNKQPTRSEILNDVDESIVHFFKILRNRRDELLEYLELLPFSYAEHERIKNDYYDGRFPEDPVKRAAEFYLLRWSIFGSTATRSGFARSGSTVQTSRAKSYANSQTNLIAVAKRLMDAVIECKDFEWIIDYYDHPDALFYCDPPYRGTERTYQSGDFDHQRLLDILSNIEGKFVLSYDHDIDQLDWWSVFKQSRYAINREGRENTEYLYMNYDPRQTNLVRPMKQSSIERFHT